MLIYDFFAPRYTANQVFSFVRRNVTESRFVVESLKVADDDRSFIYSHRFVGRRTAVTKQFRYECRPSGSKYRSARSILRSSNVFIASIVLSALPFFRAGFPRNARAPAARFLFSAHFLPWSISPLFLRFERTRSRRSGASSVSRSVSAASVG